MLVDEAEYSRRLSVVSEAEEIVTLREAVMGTLLLWGITAAYFIAPLTADPRIGRLLTNIGMPRIWERHYRASLYKVDPLPSLSQRNAAAFSWPEATDAADLTATQRRYLKIAARFGMARGMGVACYGPHGRSGFFGVAWPFKRKPQRRVVQAVHMIGQASFQRYCQLVQPTSEVQPLSNRELEVLSWMREGKSNTVIAQILEISRASVDMYVRRIFAKLEVTDRTGAVLRGYAMGLIVSNEHEKFMEEARARDAGRWFQVARPES
jgi:LuxR family quorum-sensing system transcriptional regulator CciR